MTARAPALIVLAAAACAAAGAPRTARAESIFGLNLLGERMDAADARGAALGGFVQLLDDSLGVLQYNPATMTWARRVTFAVGGYVTTDDNKSGEFEERTVSTKITGLTFAFPFFHRRVSAALGYRGRYDPDGEFAVLRETSEGATYIDRFERSGDLWTVPFQLAVDLGRYAKVGGYYSLERGTIQNRWIVDFTGSSTADAVSTQAREFEGGGWGIGGVARVAGRVSLGLAYDGAVDYDVRVKETYTNASANNAYAETMALPARWTGSATVRAGGGFVVYAGASVSDFRDFSGLAFPSERLAREESVALGVEFRNSPGALPVRVSGRWEQLPYTMPGGEEINTIAFSAGTGLLFRSRTGKLDAALQFGKTGSIDSNGYEDRFVRFFLSIAGSEEWKRKRETRF